MALGAILLRSLFPGTVATATSTVALAFAARAEGKAAVQPINATSHWLYGDNAARMRRRTVDHTGIGFVTHYAATIFWALFFKTSLRTQPVWSESVAGCARQIAAPTLPRSAIGHSILRSPIWRGAPSYPGPRQPLAIWRPGRCVIGTRGA